MSDLGSFYFEGKSGLKKDDVLALEWYKRAAEKGHASSQFNVGTFYENGRGGVERDDKMALEWYRKAAANGTPSLLLLSRVLMPDSLSVSLCLSVVCVCFFFY